MTALTAYALAALRRLDPQLSRRIVPASYLRPSEPWDFDVDLRLRTTHKLLIGRADWRHFQPAQLGLFADVALRSGPKQLGTPPDRPRMRTAVCVNFRANHWMWRDVLPTP